jgi:hypothetical protein
MNDTVIFVISENIEQQLFRSDPAWWRTTIDPLQEALDLAEAKPAWPRSG